MNKELVKLEKQFNSNQTQKSRKGRSSNWSNQLLIGLAILVVLGVIYILFFYQAEMKVISNPEQVSIALDNKEVSKNFSATPGEHMLLISASGYLSYQKNITVDYLSNQPIKVNLQKEPKFSRLDQGKISYLSFEQNKNTLFYLKDNSCWRLNLNRNTPRPEIISPAIFKNVKNLIWTKNHLGVIVQIDKPDELVGTKFYRNSSSTATYFYDFNRYDLLNQTAKFWGVGIGNISINPDRDQVAYYYSTLEPEKSLVISDLDRKRVRRVAKISEYTNPNISWAPNKEYILISNEDIISVYDSYLDRLRTPLENSSLSSAQISADSKKILYLSQSPERLKPLSIMKVDGSKKENLNINLSLKNLDWISNNQFITIGRIDDQEVLFRFDINNKKIIDYAWPEDNQQIIKQVEIDQNKNVAYLIKGTQLVSLEIVSKNY